MPIEPLQPEDIRYVNLVLQHFPEASEIIQSIKQLSTKASFPINSFDELADAMGGENTTVTFRGQFMTLAEVRKYIPAYYFPIGNEHDLIAKIADLRQRGSPGELTPPWTLPMGTPLPGVSVPSISAEDMASIAASTDTSGFIPRSN